MKIVDDAERWERVEAAFESVLRAAPEERGEIIDRLCGEDADLRAEVESLLTAHGAAADFLETPADSLAAPYLDDLEVSGAEAAGWIVGRYRLIEEIGRGGMGAVWLAERADGEFEQRVAVKLVKRGMDTDEILARFLRERRILARLEHPNIARILDGGVTEDGRPYFVMEHVPGVPITAYCDERGLSIEQRLALFEVVCRAVQHAHRNLVVHRDLKPSNVLVTDAGEVKLLDFGIAKLVEEEDEDAAAPLTRTGVRFVTPDYASPEQVRGEPVTTQSDVYQLGLLLYELLAGRRPYSLRRKTPTEIERLVCVETPARPSSVAPDGHGAGRRLRGDLDTIALTALRKEPARRYPSAEAMAEDVRRHLDGRPVRARGDRAGYRLGKFLRRHRLPVAAAAVLVALSTGFAILYTVRLRAERDRVRLEAEKATASAELLERFFVSWNPDAADREQVTARDLVDVAAARAGRASGSPEVQAATLSLIGSLYTQLAAYEPAESLLVRAEAIQRRAGALATADRAATLERLGHLLYARGDWQGAERRYREALAIRRALDGPSHARTLAAHASLATLLWATERFDQAEAELRALLALHVDEADLPVPVAQAQTTLGLVLFFEGRFEEAESVLRDALARQRRFFGHDDPITLETAGNLAAVLRDQGELDEAEQIQREVLRLIRGRYGDAHDRTLNAKFLLAMVHHRRGEYDDGIRLMREIVAVRQQRLGRDSIQLAAWLMGLGAYLLDRGDLEEAERVLVRSMDIVGPAFDEGDEAGDTLNRIAYLRIRRGGPDARAAYRRAIAFHRSRPTADPAFVTDGFHFLAWSMHRMGDVREAEALYRETLELYRAALPPDHPYVAATLTGLGELLLDAGRPAEAEPWLRQAVAAWELRAGEFAPELAMAREALDRARSTAPGER